MALSRRLFCLPALSILLVNVSTARGSALLSKKADPTLDDVWPAESPADGAPAGQAPTTTAGPTPEVITNVVTSMVPEIVYVKVPVPAPPPAGQTAAAAAGAGAEPPLPEAQQIIVVSAPSPPILKKVTRVVVTAPSPAAIAPIVKPSQELTDLAAKAAESAKQAAAASSAAVTGAANSPMGKASAAADQAYISANQAFQAASGAATKVRALRDGLRNAALAKADALEKLTLGFF